MLKQLFNIIVKPYKQSYGDQIPYQKRGETEKPYE